ncbi:MAG: diguanylate cyclase [Proteobacteria bacterium SG_bin4]|nr:MAG: diguanylate cyclase [Proteobacteria bacterium SG_bin4]
MNSQPPPPNPSHALLTEQVKLLYQQAPKALVVTLIVATALAYVYWNHVAEEWLLSWLSAVYLLTSARFLLIRSYFRVKPPITDATRWGRWFIISVGLSGLLWGTAGGIFFVSDSETHQFFLAYLLAGMIAGAMATLSYYKGAFLIFSVPVVLPFSYQVMTHETETQMVVALTFLLFVAAMGSISYRLYQTMVDSLKLRFDNFDLLKRLIQTKNDLEHRVTERTEALITANNILHQEKELFQVTLSSIGDAVITTDAAGKITFLNPIAEIFTGWSHQDAQNASLQQVLNIVHPVTREPVANPLTEYFNGTGNASVHHESLLIRRDQKEWIIDYAVAPIRNNENQIIGTVLTFRDVTEQRKLTQKLAYQAAHDSLTGLLNRKEFETRLSKILKSTRKNDTHALLYLDLDQFKIINDTCGHSAGDELLRQITALLHAKLRTRDTLARLGGDEFGIILEHCPKNEALQVANILRELVQNFRFQWQGQTFTIGVSIGLFPITATNQGLTQALNAADSACYAAKEQGRNRVHVYQANKPQQESNESQWVPRIQQALAEQRFCLFYQPIRLITTNEDQEQHGEILLRLKDEHGQFLVPGAFLPAADRHDQMLLIDRWVVKQSLQLIKAHTAAQSNTIYTINISARALEDTEFLDFTVRTIKTSQINPACICFEISEQTALTDINHVVRFVTVLKDLGCRFSIDDFSGNLSSFNLLKNIPLDYLKIDGRLIKNITTDPVNQAMVESIHHIGHVMRLKTIAVWVENGQTLQALENIGVDYAQGYWVAEPSAFNTNTPISDDRDRSDPFT